MPIIRILVISLLLTQSGWAQGIIRLKTRNIVPAASSPRTPPEGSSTAARQHFLVLFNSYPGPDVVAELAARRILVLAYVPENALMVSAIKLNLRGLDVVWAGPMDPSDKISPVIPDQPSGSYLVILQPDAVLADASELAENQGFTIIPNSHLLVGNYWFRGHTARFLR